MIRQRSLSLACCLALVMVLTGCSSTPLGPRLPVVTESPITVDGSTVNPITFSGLLVSVEPGTRLGYNHEGAGMNRTYDYIWGPSFPKETIELNDDISDIMGDAGYLTVPWQPDGEKTTSSGGTILEMRASITLLEFNSFSNAGGYYQAYCKVLWQLTNPRDNSLLLTTSTEGYKKESEHNAGVLQKAFNNALRNLLADQEFADAMAESHGP